MRFQSAVSMMAAGLGVDPRALDRRARYLREARLLPARNALEARDAKPGECVTLLLSMLGASEAKGAVAAVNRLVGLIPYELVVRQQTGAHAEERALEVDCPIWGVPLASLLDYALTAFALGQHVGTAYAPELLVASRSSAWASLRLRLNGEGASLVVNYADPDKVRAAAAAGKPLALEVDRLEEAASAPGGLLQELGESLDLPLEAPNGRALPEGCPAWQ